MPRLKPINARKLIKKLKVVGFVETHQRGSHLYLTNKAKSRVVTVPIHGAKDIPIGTLHNIVINQAGLSVVEFDKL